MCWYCYWGWPKQIADIYDDCIERCGFSAMHCGPAHVVWEDENFNCAESCLHDIDEYSGRYSADDLDVVRESLERLLKVPNEFIIPYEDERNLNPGEFPPPEYWEMVHR